MPDDSKSTKISYNLEVEIGPTLTGKLLRNAGQRISSVLPCAKLCYNVPAIFIRNR